jgi:hypothetical protein
MEAVTETVNIPVGIPLTQLKFPIDWERTRIDAAIAAMQGLLANPIAIQECWRIEDLAVKKADNLLAELRKEVAK